MKIKQSNIITLSNNNMYLVVDIINLDNEDYALLSDVKKSSNIVIVTESTDAKGNVMYTIIENEYLYIKLQKIFYERMMDNINKLDELKKKLDNNEQ